MYQFRQPKVKIVALAGSWESARLGEEPANKEVGESEGNLPYLAMRGTCKILQYYWEEPASTDRNLPGKFILVWGKTCQHLEWLK